MPSEFSGLVSYAIGMALVAARVTGAFYFIPLPAMGKTVGLAKALVILAISFALFPFWPTPDPHGPIVGLIVFGVLKEAAVGIGLGLVIALVTECFTFSFHLLGVQAGYAYASSVDPTSNADSTVLESVGKLAAGMLLFTTGLHLEVIRAFAMSLEAHPAGTWTLGPGVIAPTVALFQSMLAAGVRLALPIMAALILIDLALALAGRVASHLQLVFLSFPIKMIIAMLLIAWVLRFLPSVFTDLSSMALGIVRTSMGL